MILTDGLIAVMIFSARVPRRQRMSRRTLLKVVSPRVGTVFDRSYDFTTETYADTSGLVASDEDFGGDVGDGFDLFTTLLDSSNTVVKFYAGISPGTGFGCALSQYHDGGGRPGMPI